jgi:hypothetical protein
MIISLPSIRDIWKMKKPRKYVRVKRPPEQGTLVAVRLQQEQLELLDWWIDQQPEKMSRPAAIRDRMLVGIAEAKLRRKK